VLLLAVEQDGVYPNGDIFGDVVSIPIRISLVFSGHAQIAQPLRPNECDTLIRHQLAIGIVDASNDLAVHRDGFLCDFGSGRRCLTNFADHRPPQRFSVVKQREDISDGLIRIPCISLANGRATTLNIVRREEKGCSTDQQEQGQCCESESQHGQISFGSNLTVW